MVPPLALPRLPTPRPRRRALAALAALAGGVLGPAAGAAAPGALIAAASDLKFALDELAAAFERSRGVRLRIAYGSSGNLYQQIDQGAPFELFMSADEQLVFELAVRDRTIDRGALYAIGRLVLFAPHGARWTPDAALAGLRQALAAGQITRFAIANPQHAPYGRAAQQALQQAGLWPAIEPRLVLGENVAQAAQFASSGSAQGGMFALSLAMSPALAQAGRRVTLPATMHDPLRQRMALVRGAGDVARAFYAHLQQSDAKDVLKRHGFTLPGPG